MAPANKPWKIEKSQGHWHVRISRDEVLDVADEKIARFLVAANSLKSELKIALKRLDKYRPFENNSEKDYYRGQFDVINYILEYLNE